MADTKYTFSISGDFPNQAVSVDRLTQEIQDSTVTIALSHINVNEDDCDIWFKDVLSSDNSSTLVLIVSSHSGEALPQTATPVKIAEVDSNVKQPVSLSDEFRDKSGKLRVHQTSRKEGLAIHWSGRGDDRNSPRKFGSGSALSYKHLIGDSTSHTVYIDYNGLLNETWMHEVILTWSGCELDTLLVDVVPDTCTVIDSTAGNYTKYDSILLPAVPGTGDCNITSDVLAYHGGLVARDSPSDATQVAAPAFWNADFNTTTEKFENLTAAPNGDGAYNIFYKEVVLNRLFNYIQLLKNGFQIFNSSDTDRITHGYRIRVIFHTTLPDHEWTISGTLVMHRKYVMIDCDGNFV